MQGYSWNEGDRIGINTFSNPGFSHCATASEFSHPSGMSIALRRACRHICSECKQTSPLCVRRLVSRCPRRVNAGLKHSVLLQPHDERIYFFYVFMTKHGKA